MLLNLGHEHPIESLQAVAEGQAVPELARQVWQVHVDDTVRQYIVRLTAATRRHKDFILGASPRGSLALYRGSQAWAALQGRDYVLPDDVKRLVIPILAHRCLVHPESSLRGINSQQIIQQLIKETPLEIGQLGDKQPQG